MAKKRRGNKDDSKPQKKKKMEIICSKNEHITIEEVFARFPNLSEGIFGRLDDRSLVSCREVSKTWLEYVDSQRIFWIRKILKYANSQSKFHGEWQMILDKTPIKTLKKFARFVWLDPQTEASPLYAAGALGDIELFNRIKEKTGLNEDSKNNRGNTAFHIAAANNQLNLCKVIIEKIKDKNPGCNNGRTPLHQAARKGHLKMCKLIMEKLQNKNPGCNIGITPLHEAAAGGHVNIYQLIYEKIAATGLRLRSLKPVKKVDEMNPGNNKGSTPLHVAAKYGQLDVCEFLCLNLEEKSPKDEGGATPLHIAAKYGQFEICKLLCMNLKEKNPKDEFGRTPVSIAYDNEKWEILHFLIAENNFHCS